MTQRLTEEQLQEIEAIAAPKEQGDSINSHDGLCVDDLRTLVAEVRRLRGLLTEARATFEMWKDAAPAVSLCRDIDAALNHTQQ